MNIKFEVKMTKKAMFDFIALILPIQALAESLV